METKIKFGVYYDEPVVERRGSAVAGVPVATAARRTIAEKRDIIQTKCLGIVWNKRSDGAEVGMSADYPNLIFRRDANGGAYYEPFDEVLHNEQIAEIENQGWTKRASAKWREDMLKRSAELNERLRQPAVITH
jgi:hypothetical protein